MRNTFSSQRPEGVGIYLNELAVSDRRDSNRIGEALGIFQRRLEAIEKYLLQPDWVVSGNLWIGTSQDAASGALLQHSAHTYIDGEGCLYLKIHEGTSLPATTGWGEAEKGYLFFHTTYRHTLRWTGSAWEYAPWDGIPGGTFILSAIALGVGWKECDGSSTAYLKGDGTTANVTLPPATTTNPILMAGAAYVGSGGTVAAIGAAYTDIVFRLFFRL